MAQILINVLNFLISNIGVNLFQSLFFKRLLMKKKYEKKKPSQQGLRPNQSMSQIRVNNFDEESEDISFRFDFKDRQILHLWLVSILPGNKFLNFKINLNEKKICGNIIQCEKKLEQCSNHLKCHALKSIQDLSYYLSDNMQIAIQVKFNAKIFEKNIILEACEQISHKYNYKNILEIKDLIEEKKYFYLVSLQNLYSNDFTSWFVQHKDDNITRDQILQIRSESKIRSESQLFTSSADQGGFYKPSLKNKSSQQEINYYSVQNSKTQDEQKQSSVEDEVLSQQQAQSSFYNFYDTGKQKNQEKKKEVTKNDATAQKDESKKKKKYIRKEYNPSESDIMNASYIRKSQKVKKIFEKMIPLNVYDEDIFKSWVRNNKKLQWQDFIVEKIDGKVNISLKTTGNPGKDEEKIESITIFFSFQKVILIDALSTQQRKKVVEKYCQPSGQAISCKLIQGYMEPSDHEHKLRHLIRQNRIEKSGKKCKKFYAMMIIGIKHEVDSLSKKITEYMTSLPKQNLNQTVFLQLGDIEKYVYENKVQIYIEKAIKQYAKKFTQMQVNNVTFTINKVLLDISIKHDQYQDFKKGKLKNIVEDISKCLAIEDIFNEEDYFDQLADKYLIMKSETTPHKYVLIAEKNKAAGFVKEILEYIFNNRGKIEQKMIPIKQSRCVAIKKFLESVIQNSTSKQLKESLKISFPNENTLQVYGSKKHVKQIQVIVNQFLIKLEDEAIEKTFFVNDLLSGVVEKNMDKFKKAVEIDFGLSFELRKNVDLGVVIYMGSDSCYYNNPFSILIQKSRNIQKLPNSSLICFQSQNDLNFFSGRSLAQFKAFMHGKNKAAINQLKDASRDLQYVYTEGYKDFNQLFLQLWAIYPYQNNAIKTFSFVMPKIQKKKFIFALISFCEQHSKDGKSKIRVHIFEESNEDLRKSLANLQDEYVKPEKQFRYYVFDQKQYYYSKGGEQKIKQAVERGNNFVYLTNQDLNLQSATHICSLKDLKLTHIQSGVQTKIQQLYHNRYMFTLKGTQFVIPDKQIDIVLKDMQKGVQASNVSIGAYELDLKKMKQTNLFSGFVRDLKKTEITILKKQAGKLVVNFDEKVNQIQIIHEKKDEMKAVKACEAILKMIQAEKTKIDHEIEKPMKKQQFEMVKSACQEIDVNVEWDGAKKLVFSGFDKASITNFIKNIKLFQIEHNQIKYPATWCEQKNEIETFIVPETTKQFQDVQAVFKIGKIKQLMRIQNTLVYKKYEDEKQCLTKLNEGKAVRQLMLFHGTRTTDPKIIYQDKQECFNINYTGDNNYLGRGTYFAEKSQYSDGYAYTSQNTGRMFMFGQKTKEMFYCSVLVGDSQTVNQDKYSGNMRDTQFKDNVKKIRYESATTFTNGSIIYTVYKNRRAYPSYLIRY